MKEKEERKKNKKWSRRGKVKEGIKNRANDQSERE